MDLPGAGTGAALEEREAVGVEQDAVTRRHVKSPATGAVVDHAEEDEQLRPGAVALVHRVRVEGVVLAQPLVQPRERVVAQERLVLGQHVALLGVEQEHEPQDHGEQRAVDLVGVLGERLRAAARPPDASCAAWKPRSSSYSACSTCSASCSQTSFWNLRLSLKQRGETLRARERQQARFAEQQPHRGADRPARGLHHVGDAEVEPARALAARRGDQPQRAAVEEQAGWHARLAQQPLHPAVRSGLERPRRSSKSARIRSCQGDAPSCGSRSRTARSGRRVSP